MIDSKGKNRWMMRDGDAIRSKMSIALSIVSTPPLPRLSFSFPQNCPFLRPRYVLKADAEVTLEVNPSVNVDAHFLRAFRDVGVNRISVGVQTLASDRELQVGPHATAKQTD